MLRLKNPSWLDDLYSTTDSELYSEKAFGEVNQRLDQFTKSDPVVSVVIAAYNEEATILKCIDSLSRSNSKYPFEIVLVDNNSADRTAEIAKRLHITYLFEKQQGPAFARQQGQEKARGKYILSADADSQYPTDWINELMRPLTKPGVAAVFGRYSFLADSTRPRWKLTIYETLSDILARIKAYKRPFLSCYGMSMGYVREYGLKVGYIDANIRGEDGRLAFGLMKYGSIKGVYSNKARVWTNTRTIGMDGNLFNAVKVRIVLALVHMGSFMKKAEDHDTRTSPNVTSDYTENIKTLKKKLGLKK